MLNRQDKIFLINRINNFFNFYNDNHFNYDDFYFNIITKLSDKKIKEKVDTIYTLEDRNQIENQMKAVYLDLINEFVNSLNNNEMLIYEKHILDNFITSEIYDLEMLKKIYYILCKKLDISIFAPTEMVGFIEKKQRPPSL